jgi:hypothetical protein
VPGVDLVDLVDLAEKLDKRTVFGPGLRGRMYLS